MSEHQLGDAPRVGVAMSWQPIETAPRDGTPILLFDPDTTDPQIWVACWCEFEGDGGSDWIDYGAHPTVIAGPTHWQPLPEPPQ